MKVERDFILDSSLALYLPLYELDGASFISKDAYGHLCTVSGALWTPDGRLFDGNDDNIILPANWMPATGTIEIWAKWNKANSHHIVSSDVNEISVYTNPNYNFYYDGTSRIIFAIDWANDTFVHLSVTYIKNGACILYANGVQKDTGTCPDTTPTNVATRLGSATDGANDFTGTIGEVRIYNRALTPLEIQQNYLATKWRYQ